MGGVGPDNLNLVEMDQPLDQKEERIGPLRTKLKTRFRPDRGVAGQEPEFFEGQSGGRSQSGGYGTDNPPDVGVPGIFAGKKREVPELEPTMPNAKRESDPLEEGQTIETHQQFYDMQQR